MARQFAGHRNLEYMRPIAKSPYGLLAIHSEPNRPHPRLARFASKWPGWILLGNPGSISIRADDLDEPASTPANADVLAELKAR